MSLQLCQIYKLKIEDSLIIHTDNNTNIYLILEGALIISKVFTNQETLSLGIFTSQDIISTYFGNTLLPNYFYQIQALSETYIISISNNQAKLFKEIIGMQYKRTWIKYQNMIEILAHKNIKNRFIHLLLTLSEIFGITYNQQIHINLTLSYYTIATIIGGNRNTISKLIKNLQRDKLISYQINKIIIFNLIQLSLYRYR
uniref:Global nitrogen transcriptional regulator n=1 Tax=Batrachospermum sp. TaxID=31373 RepID=A0A8K1YV08_9FLOR|nr:global nitrogen transcriptional regulator [Batrachospermum sp.]